MNYFGFYPTLPTNSVKDIKYSIFSILKYFFRVDLFISVIRSQYEANKIEAAQRPFAFIDFDSIVERNRKAFNKQKLTINEDEINKIENELKVKKPQNISVQEIKLEMGKKRGAELLTLQPMSSR